MNITGKKLAEIHGLSAATSLFRQTGDWYHVPSKFPAILFDNGGYIRFETQGDYEVFIANGSGHGVSQNVAKNWLRIKNGIANTLDYIPLNETDIDVVPGEIIFSGRFSEGVAKPVLVNRFERDRHAREECIKRWGTECCTCGFDFRSQYGRIGEGFIHVHHLVPLSSIGSEYEVDPINDLRPVCANCHAMLHRRDPPYTLEELMRFLSNKAPQSD